jgi:cytochrome c oxidase subunit 2
VSTPQSPIVSPPTGWASKFPRDEKIFFFLVIGSVVAMTTFSIGWLVWGSHNVPTRAEIVGQKEYAAKVTEFAKRYEGPDGKVWVPPGTDGYMLAYRYGWTPELVLQEDVETTIWISSADVLHGFSVVGQNLNLQIAPKHGFGAVLTPDEPGRYRIICNEYCGLGHQDMTSFITVVTASEMASAQQSIAAGATDDAAGTGASGAAGVLEIAADASNALAFDVDELSADAGPVTISMANPSALPHNVAVKGNGVDVKGEVVTTGGTSTVETELEAGTYTFYCSVPGHEAGGMTGTLSVS